MKIILNGDLNMRLYNIYHTCKEAMKDIKNLKAETLPKAGIIRIISWEAYQQALQNIVIFDFIKDDVMKAYNLLNPIEREKEIPEISSQVYRKLIEKNNIILTKLDAVIDLYESMKDGVSQPGIDIKIPTCDSLKDYINILENINFVFTQCPYLKNENEEIKYKGTDVGSDWITFVIVVSSAVSTGFIILNNLALLLNKAIALVSNKKLLDMQDEMLKTMQLKNEATQETMDTFKKMKEITYKQYVDELQEELGKLENGEEEGRVSKSLEKLANLLDKGVEIHTSIETPKDIKVLFPFAEPQQTLSDNLLKYLEDKNISNNNE